MKKLSVITKIINVYPFLNLSIIFDRRILSDCRVSLDRGVLPDLKVLPCFFFT